MSQDVAGRKWQLRSQGRNPLAERDFAQYDNLTRSQLLDRLNGRNISAQTSKSDLVISQLGCDPLPNTQQPIHPKTTESSTAQAVSATTKTATTTPQVSKRLCKTSTQPKKHSHNSKLAHCFIILVCFGIFVLLVAATHDLLADDIMMYYRKWQTLLQLGSIKV